MWKYANDTSVTLSGSSLAVTALESNNFWNQELVSKLELRISEYITELPDENFNLLMPIPIELTPAKSGGWVASFLAANITMSGEDPLDAKRELVYNILDTMELFVSEQDKLIPLLRRSLDILHIYVEVIN